MNKTYSTRDYIDDPLTVRAYNCLNRAAITDLRQVAPMTDEQLMNIKHMTEDALVSIKRTLMAAGLERGCDYGYVPEEVEEPLLPAFLVEDRGQGRDCFAERYVEPICSALKERGLYNKEDISKLGRVKFSQIPGITVAILSDVANALQNAGLPF